MTQFTFKVDASSVGHLVLTRPEVHNAFDDQLILDLTKILNKIKERTDVRLLVLSSEGKSFCAGADLNWMSRMKNYSLEENHQDSLRLSGLFQSFNDLDIPVIGRVQGHCLGGGVGLVSVCDHVIAAEKALFGLTEVQLGLIPAVISPFVVAKIGLSQARRFFLSGEKFSAILAKEIGLIHEVVEIDNLDQAIEQAIERFLQPAPEAQRHAKRLLRWLESHQLATYEETAKRIAAVRIGDEAQEGMMALLEKRRPKWSKKS